MSLKNIATIDPIDLENAKTNEYEGYTEFKKLVNPDMFLNMYVCILTF